MPKRPGFTDSENGPALDRWGRSPDDPLYGQPPAAEDAGDEGPPPPPTEETPTAQPIPHDTGPDTPPPPSQPEPRSPYDGPAPGPTGPTLPTNLPGPQVTREQTLNPALERLIAQLMESNAAQLDMQKKSQEEKTAWSETIRRNLLEALGRAKEPVTEQDPIIARQSQVADFNNQRTLQGVREAMAARGGTTSGAADAAVQSGTENLGIAKNSLVSRLMADEVDKRRASAENLLGVNAGILQGDEAVSAQRDLAQLQSLVTSLRNRSDNLNESRGMDITEMLGLGGLANNRLGIMNQNQQFYDNLGYTSAHDAAMLNYLYAQLAGGA